MGMLINSKSSYMLFKDDVSSSYYIDKSAMLDELVRIVEPMSDTMDESDIYDESRGKGNKYICIIRPRRFGKTMMTNLIAAYFSKGIDSGDIFRKLDASKYDWYERHLNKHNVVYIRFNDVPEDCNSYKQYIGRIERLLKDDLLMMYKDIRINDNDSVWDAFGKIVEYGHGEKFIFVLDEWDYIFHQDFVSDADRRSFIKFLNMLLKDRPYVELAYMTGILPIAKYSSGSELNMFYEYTMATREKYSTYFGFTDEEVDKLYEKYIGIETSPKISRDELAEWYNGYHTVSGIKLYNPRSVVGALSDNQIGDFWTSAGPYDEIFYYVRNDINNIRNDIAVMMAGTPIKANVSEYAATSMNLKTRDEIYSAMVVYGFLSYDDGYVMIPNRELMDKFADMVSKEESFGAIYQMAKESESMLNATLNGDTELMTEIMEKVHNSESPKLYYNDEAELSSVLNMVYIQARNSYRVEREHPAGAGYADMFFYPNKPDGDCIVAEFKVDASADEAIDQIKDRKYAMRFMGKAGETQYTGRILAVGIAYYKSDSSKRHECKVEVIRDRI